METLWTLEKEKIVLMNVACKEGCVTREFVFPLLYYFGDFFFNFPLIFPLQAQTPEQTREYTSDFKGFESLDLVWLC
jgi:hypothetical protein